MEKFMLKVTVNHLMEAKKLLNKLRYLFKLQMIWFFSDKVLEHPEQQEACQQKELEVVVEEFLQLH